MHLNIVTSVSFANFDNRSGLLMDKKWAIAQASSAVSAI